MGNQYGDVELSAEGMRALAHPVRLRLLTVLREAPATATQLSESVGASPSVASWHLRLLASYGLVSDAPELGSGRERYWRAASGFHYAITDEASRAAANVLEQALAAEQPDVVGRWRREVEPRLNSTWRAVAGTADTTVTLTSDELAAVNRAYEDLLAPYVTRTKPPRGSAPVRIVHTVMPTSTEGADDAPASR